MADNQTCNAIPIHIPPHDLDVYYSCYASTAGVHLPTVCFYYSSYRSNSLPTTSQRIEQAHDIVHVQDIIVVAGLGLEV